MNLKLTIIRINPNARSVTAMKATFPKNAVGEVRRILRAGKEERIGWNKLLEIEEKRLTQKAPHPKLAGMMIDQDMGPTPLVAAGLMNVSEDQPKWKLRGCEEHAGIGMLFGQGLGGGMVDVPVSVGWVLDRIQWIDGEDLDALQERAEALVPALPDEVAAALRAAVDGGPLAEGATSLWLPVTEAKLLPAMIRLGLGDESTAGQRLTRLGGAVREFLIQRRART